MFCLPQSSARLRHALSLVASSAKLGSACRLRHSRRSRSTNWSLALSLRDSCLVPGSAWQSRRSEAMLAPAPWPASPGRAKPTSVVSRGFAKRSEAWQSLAMPCFATLQSHGKQHIGFVQRGMARLCHASLRRCRPRRRSLRG